MRAEPASNLRVIRRIAGDAEHHPDRITEHDPATTRPESLGAQPNQPRRAGRDVVGAQVDVGPHRSRRVVGTQPLEEELSAGAGRWVELAGELVTVSRPPSPASRLLPERDLLIMQFRRESMQICTRRGWCWAKRCAGGRA